MSTNTVESRGLATDLGGGLVLRQATPEDTEDLAEFQAVINSTLEGPDESIRVWTRDLMSGGLPDFAAGDFTVVEDTGTHAIVSSLNLISQTWSYDGVELGVGRVELVATHPDYRRRGLIRAQMDVVHEWSARRGEVVQAITGIPWYYRRFGYEMALETGGGRAGYAADLPDEDGRYTLRPATQADLPLLVELYDGAMQRYLVSSVRDSAMWGYELSGRSDAASHRHEIRVIEDTSREPAGYLLHSPAHGEGGLSATGYELGPEASWEAVTPSVVRYLWRTGKEYTSRSAGAGPGAFVFSLGTEHPMYEAAEERLPITDRPYAWYVRVPDLPGFVRHIGPVLERRLAGSGAAGHTGELKISFVDDGVKLAFREGRLARVERWVTTQEDSRLGPKVRDALFPGLTFLQLLFGFRSVEDLEYAFPDCIMSSQEARDLLNILFPKRASWVWGIE